MSIISGISFAKKYSKVVYPLVDSKINEYKVYTGRIKMHATKAKALEALEKSRFDMAVSSVLCVYPNVDLVASTDIICSFQSITRYLNEICRHSQLNSEPFLRVIFSSLKDALNIRTEEFEKYFTFFPSKEDDGYLSILVEKCRQKVRLLPSFDAVRDYISAYLSLYIDLQILKFSCDDDNKGINLTSWSAAHGQKYPDISNWEFCLAVDSPLTLHLLLAMATIPELSEKDIEGALSVFFPWIAGVHKILEGYINYNDTAALGSQYNFYYTNLKEYEDRIIYFIQKGTSDNREQSHLFRLLLKLLLSIYITHPKADTGMNKLTWKALVAAGGKNMFFYLGIVRFLRSMKKI